MKNNLHPVDRAARLLFAAVVALLYSTGAISGTAGLVLGIAAAVLAVTAFISFCPIYYALGISTNRKAHGNTPGTVK